MDPNTQTPPAPPATDTEDQDWGAAANEFATDKGLDPGKPADPTPPEPSTTPPAEPPAAPPAEDKKSEEGKQTPPADPKKPEVDPNETPEQKVEREKLEAEEAAKKEPEIKDDPAGREARGAYHQLTQDRKAMAKDVQEKLYPDLQTELTDADGDPIRTVEDVMRLTNPQTGKPFTDIEATQWLFHAQKHHEKQLAETEKKVEQIADINLSLKDQADAIRIKYGALLEANPNGIRDRVWAAYQNTLKKDEKTGVIIEAPVSLQEFYETTLAPYEELARRLQTEEEVKDKKTEAQNLKQTQSDRTDVVAGGKSDTMDPEEREWAEVAEDYYKN